VLFFGLEKAIQHEHKQSHDYPRSKQIMPCPTYDKILGVKRIAIDADELKRKMREGHKKQLQILEDNGVITKAEHQEELDRMAINELTDKLTKQKKATKKATKDFLKMIETKGDEIAERVEETKRCKPYEQTEYEIRCEYEGGGIGFQFRGYTELSQAREKFDEMCHRRHEFDYDCVYLDEYTKNLLDNDCYDYENLDFWNGYDE